MGQTVSGPLDLTLAHWPEVREAAHNLSLLIKKVKWITFCRSEWPLFQVGWPLGGSFSPLLIQAVKDVVFRGGQQGHPDQQAYILVWQDLSESPPPWVKLFPTYSPPKVLPARAPPSVLPESQGDLISWDLHPPPSYAPPVNRRPPTAPSLAPATPDPPTSPSLIQDEGPALRTRSSCRRCHDPEVAITLFGPMGQL